MNVDVIIPSRTCPDRLPILAKCIRSLRESEQSFKFNVIVVENFSPVDAGQDVTIEYDREVFQYNHALAQGIKKTSTPWVVLANNDLAFQHSWLLEVLKAHSDRLDVLSFTPWNSLNGWHDNLIPNPQNITLGYRTSYEFGGWCVVTKREVLEKLDLGRTDIYSDSAYALELEQNNILHGLVRKSKVERGTTKRNCQNDTKTDRLTYLELS